MCIYIIFFFNDTATTEIYTLSLHDALPISGQAWRAFARFGRIGRGIWSRVRPIVGERGFRAVRTNGERWQQGSADRKSTRLNSSHANISYAVFCLKKKKNVSSETVQNRRAV